MTKEINKVLDINNNFVIEFFETTSTENQKWIKDKIEFWINEKGERYFFPPFRTEFAKKFFPNLFSKNKKKPSLLDKLIKIEEAQRSN